MYVYNSIKKLALTSLGFLFTITWMVVHTVDNYSICSLDEKHVSYVTHYTSMQAKTFSAARSQEPFVSLGQAFNGTWLHRIKQELSTLLMCCTVLCFKFALTSYTYLSLETLHHVACASCVSYSNSSPLFKCVCGHPAGVFKKIKIKKNTHRVREYWWPRKCS